MPTIVRLSIYKLRIRFSSAISPEKNNTFSGDGFTTTNFLGFRTDEKFNIAFSTAIRSIPKDGPENLQKIEWRAHISTWAANQALRIGEGDFVECGVWYGALSKTICEYLKTENFGDRIFYLVDTFGASEGGHRAEKYQKTYMKM